MRRRRSTASGLSFTDGTQRLGTKATLDGQVFTWDTGTNTWRAESPAAAGVTSVNGDTGVVVLTAADVGAIEEPSSSSIGQLMVYDGGAWNKLAAGTTGQVLTAVTGDVPAWGSVPLLTTQLAFACVNSALVARINTSTDGGATWTAGSNVAADHTGDTGGTGATVSTSGISVPTAAGSTAATPAACQYWTWDLDGTGGLRLDLDPAGTHRFLQMMVQGIFSNNGSAAIAAIYVGIHPKGDLTKGVFMGRRIDGAGDTKLEYSTGGAWTTGGNLTNPMTAVAARVTLLAGVAYETPWLDRRYIGAWGVHTNVGSSFGTVSALSVSVLVRAWQAGSGPHVIPFSGSFSSSVVG